MVDGGAFTGDTLDALLAAGLHFEALAAFEPDLANFARLRDSVVRHGLRDAVLFPCGLGDTTARLRFATGHEAASGLSADGADFIQVVALDDVLPAFEPNFIKLDIEGAEPAALRGMRQTLRAPGPRWRRASIMRPSTSGRYRCCLVNCCRGIAFTCAATVTTALTLLPMHFRDAVFDLDGTLIDSLGGIEASAHHAVAQCLPGRDLPPLRTIIGPPIARMFAGLWPDLSAEQLDALVAAFRAHYDTHGCLLSPLYPGVADSLAELRGRGVRSFVLTNKPSGATNAILNHTGIAALFADVVCPDTAQPHFSNKPDAARALCEKHHLAPEQSVVIGDGSDDADAARRCGMRFAVAGYGYGKAAGSPPPDAHACSGPVRRRDQASMAL